ncbi:FliM/FliN family flagellar motor C-terminal domain-containing protein [Candidatus Thiodiazotropha sp. CDECU1]|uniref:FliM/FliN family flagellar motor C-terminal domain-containing protein n=1 Tax=Candidatus Thiodiazotropha sp. CDECU1 TaxID=3065865 RepID=UPI00292E0008|nr:FliM/FliN family flagellar motor C-terminal domain-containing protein [Candidatus Thiodiazotropha sp. CDECU1]
MIGERLGGSFKQALEPIVKGWAEDWLPDNTTYSLNRLLPLFDYCQENGTAEIDQLVSWVDDNWCGLLKPVEKGLLGSILIGVTDKELRKMASSTLLQDVAQQALSELAQRILSANKTAYESVPIVVTDNPMPKGSELRGSGALALNIRIGGLSLDYVVSPMTVERYLEAQESPAQTSPQKLTRLHAALANQKLSARVSLGSAALSLGELATMRIGDVVALDKHIDEPALMRLGFNGDACDGFIGTKGESLAIRLSRVGDQKS